MPRLYIFLILNLLILVPGVASAAVLINEIAWMGTASSASDEWMELYNNGNTAVDLSGWTLAATDGTPYISLQGSIPAQSFFLLERTNDATVPDVSADMIYTGALSNSGEILVLRNASGAEVDRADGSGGWAIGGNNDTKETAQRTASGWITAAPTPKAATGGLAQNATLPATNPSPAADTRNLTPPFTAKIYGGGGTLTSGEVAEFRGGAAGLTAEEAGKARFLWSFGDGSYAEGAIARHAYLRAGEYSMSFNVIAEPYSASDYAQVLVVTAEPATSAKAETVVSSPVSITSNVALPAVRELPAAAATAAADAPAVGVDAKSPPSAVNTSGATAFIGGNFPIWFLISLATGIFGAAGFLAVKIYFRP